MSLRLYLDDCAFSHRLRRLLVQSGHDVQVPADVRPSLTGAEDDVHFAHAIRTGRVLLTWNPGDFKLLHKRFPDHPGVLVVYQDNDRTRDMTDPEVVRAIANLESTGVKIAGGCWKLNDYRW